MKLTLLFLVSIYLLTGCGVKSEPIPTTVATDTTEVTQPLTTEEAVTTEHPFEIELTEDSMKDPYGVAINSLGHIYVSDMGNDRVLIFDENGMLLDKWDKQGREGGAFNSMGFGGLAIDANDNVFVVDNGNYRIQKFDKAGSFITQWGIAGNEKSQFVRAIGITVDLDGNIYVTDDGNPYVQKFDNDGNFLMRFGGLGDGAGLFRHATGIAVDLIGNVFVADYETKCVQKFDSSGKFLIEWKMGTDIGVSGTPEGIAVDAEGNVFVTDYDLGRLQVFNNEGNFMWALGGKTIDSNPFDRPTAIAFDGAGNMVIVNQLTAKLTVIELP